MSSERPAHPAGRRCALFKTAGGSYVLEKVGRSVMTHMPGCPRIIGRIPRFQEAHPGEEPEYGFWFDDCVPEEYDFTQLLSEEGPFLAVIADQPDRVVEASIERRKVPATCPASALTFWSRRRRSIPYW